MGKRLPMRWTCWRRNRSRRHGGRGAGEERGDSPSRRVQGRVGGSSRLEHGNMFCGLDSDLFSVGERIERAQRACYDDGAMDLGMG